MHTCQSTLLNSRFLESTFRFYVGFRARHNFHLLINRYRSKIDLPALLPLKHTTCVTHRARRPTLSECVVIVMLLLQLLIGPLDWTRKIETTSSKKKIYSAKS